VIGDDTLRARNIEHLYCEWHGHYVLLQLARDMFGFPIGYNKIRPLDYAEALTYVCGVDEALRIVAAEKGIE
jgi:hypothetical protein